MYKVELPSQRCDLNSVDTQIQADVTSEEAGADCIFFIASKFLEKTQYSLQTQTSLGLHHKVQHCGYHWWWVIHVHNLVRLNTDYCQQVLAAMLTLTLVPHRQAVDRHKHRTVHVETKNEFKTWLALCK